MLQPGAPAAVGEVHIARLGLRIQTGFSPGVIRGAADLREGASLDLNNHDLLLDATIDPSGDDIPGDTTGNAAWSASVSLAEKLADSPELVAGCHVLEVGCGCGLAGLAAAAAGAASVTLTDGFPLAVESAARNAEMAGGEVAARCRAEPLVWGDAAAAAGVVRRCEGRLDVVLGADVGYDPSNMDDLALTLAAAAAAVSPPAKVLIAQESRWKDVDGWFRESLQGAGLSLVKEEKIAQVPGGRDVYLLHYKLSEEKG